MNAQSTKYDAVFEIDDGPEDPQPLDFGGGFNNDFNQ